VLCLVHTDDHDDATKLSSFVASSMWTESATVSSSTANGTEVGRWRHDTQKVNIYVLGGGGKLFGSKLGFASAEQAYWIHFRVRFDGVHAFGYNSAESELMWMKSGSLWVHCRRLALADFGRDPLSSESWRARRIFCQINNARVYRFPVCQISRRGRFFKKNAKNDFFTTSCDFRLP